VCVHLPTGTPVVVSGYLSRDGVGYLCGYAYDLWGYWLAAECVDEEGVCVHLPTGTPFVVSGYLSRDGAGYLCGYACDTWGYWLAAECVDEEGNSW